VVDPRLEVSDRLYAEDFMFGFSFTGEEGPFFSDGAF